jgi:NAD(P)-dependent dehydrogenase (short-subunit alcohol dehydrogenase family)
VGTADPRTLKDRAIVVTGASRGIGRDIAIRAATTVVHRTTDPVETKDEFV